MNSGEFLGVGWQLPIGLDEEDKIGTAHYEDCIRQSIWMILSTAPGERVMRPDFGCGIQDMVFSPGNTGTIARIVNDVRRSLIDWEPRIDVLDVDAIPDDSQPTCLLIQINYRVRTTNNRFNLVYPFYLE